MFCCKPKAQRDVRVAQDDASDDIRGKMRDNIEQAVENDLENGGARHDIDIHVG